MTFAQDGDQHLVKAPQVLRPTPKQEVRFGWLRSSSKPPFYCAQLQFQSTLGPPSSAQTSLEQHHFLLPQFMWTSVRPENLEGVHGQLGTPLTSSIKCHRNKIWRQMTRFCKGHTGTVYVIVYSDDIAFSFIENWYESVFLKLECLLDMIKFPKSKMHI